MTSITKDRARVSRTYLKEVVADGGGVRTSTSLLLLDTVAATGALPEGRMADVLPYCPFPDRAMLANLKRRGLRLTDAADLAAAARLSLR